MTTVLDLTINKTLEYETTEISEMEPYPDFTQIPVVRFIFVAVYIIVMVLAVVGNAVVCCTVFSNRKMHTAVNYYIVNLAICDFLVGVFVLPLKLLELTSPAHWGILSDTLCTVMMYVQTIFVFASVLTLVAICIERYMAVLHPLESRMHQTKARAKRILCIVWALPCVVAIPFLYPSEAFSNTLQSEYGEISRLTCFIGLPEEFRRAYYTFLFVFMYILPLSFIAVTCYRVARCLLQGIPVHRQGSIRRQEANRRKIAKMVLMVILAFAVSWTPYFLVSIITQYQTVNFMHKENFFFTMLCINLFAFVNSCVNPFIYAAMSTRFRSGFRGCFRVVCLLALCSQREVENDIMDPRIADRTRGKKNVRFMCEPPMSCFMAQSSSEGNSGSNARMSETSQRTACTTVPAAKRGSSFFHSIIMNNAGSKFLAQYLKKDRDVKHNGQIPMLEVSPDSDSKTAQPTIPMPIFSTLGKSQLSRKSCCSAGDITLASNFMASDESFSGNRRSSSCLDLRNNHRTQSQLFTMLY